jgi:membrane protein YdbS with pleckstrin-like domain
MSDLEQRPEWVSLDDDEEIVWAGEPSVATLYGTIVTGLVLLVVLIGLLVLLGLPFAYLRIKNTDYVVTNKALYVKRGVLSTNIETVDLDRIQNTEFRESFWGKQFDYGELLISTAGSGGAEITFDGIADAKSVRDRVDELRSTRVSRGGDGMGGDAGGGSAGSTPASEEQLTELIAEVRATREAFERIEDRLVEDATDDPEATNGHAAGNSSGGEADPVESDPAHGNDPKRQE